VVAPKLLVPPLVKVNCGVALAFIELLALLLSILGTFSIAHAYFYLEAAICQMMIIIDACVVVVNTNVATTAWGANVITSNTVRDEEEISMKTCVFSS
jgi:hypothetical protein